MRECDVWCRSDAGELAAQRGSSKSEETDGTPATGVSVGDQTTGDLR